MTAERTAEDVARERYMRARAEAADIGGYTLPPWHELDYRTQALLVWWEEGRDD